MESKEPVNIKLTEEDIGIAKKRAIESEERKNRLRSKYGVGTIITNEALTKERNIFLVGFIYIAVTSIIFRLFVVFGSPINDIDTVLKVALLLTFLAKGIFIYLTFRLSRFLKQPVWLTVLYCLLSPFSLLYLIPLIGLLVGVKNARKALLSGNTCPP